MSTSSALTKTVAEIQIIIHSKENVNVMLQDS